MKVKIIAEMTSAERDELMSRYCEGWSIEEVVFEMVAPQDKYQDIEVRIIDD